MTRELAALGLWVQNEYMTTTVVADQVRARLRVHLNLPSPAQRRALREAAGLSQQELADAIGVSQGAIQHWELGRRTPRGKLLDRYVEALTALREATRAPEAA